MAKIRDIIWNKKGKAGDNVRVDSTVTVDMDGVFYLSIPEFLVKTARSLSIACVFSHKKYRVISKTLEDGKDMISRMIDEYLTCEEESEMVIRYDYTASCNYAKDPDGKIHPNGTYCKGGYKWNEPVGRTTSFSTEYSTHDYSVGFKARVVLKTTYIRASSKQIKYSSIDEHLLGEYGQMLNAFSKVSISNSCHELPYSEKTAKLFYESMIALCNISDRLDALLSSPDNLLNMPDKLLIA